MISRSERSSITCPETGKPFDADVWTIVDADERPDLLEAILVGTLHVFTSPFSNRAVVIEPPLLVVDRKRRAPLLYSPTSTLPDLANRLKAFDLVEAVRQAVGAEWNETWRQRLAAAERKRLPNALQNWEAADVCGRADELLRSREGERQQNIEDAIALLGEFLSRWAPSLLENFRGDGTTVVFEAVHRPLTGHLFDLLGRAYAHRKVGERGRNAEFAYRALVAAYGNTSRDDTDVYAAACSNLANALEARVEGSLARNHAQAIELLREAVALFDPVRVPKKRAAALSNLGGALRFSRSGSKALNLESAIAAYRESFALRKRETDAQGRATTAMNLALTYLDRELGNRRRNVEMALRLANESLRFRPRERMPEIWADTVLTRAQAFASRLRGDREANRLAARRDLVEARAVYFAQEDDVKRLRWAIAWAEFLGTAAIADETEQAFGDAVEIGARLVAQDFWAGRRIAAGPLGLAMVHASLALERGDLSLALQRLDATKARMFRLATLREELVRPQLAEIRELEKARAAARTRDRFSTRIDDASFVDAINEANAALAEQMKGAMPAVPELGTKEILALIPPGSLLFAPLITSRGCSFFLIPGGAAELSPDFIHRIDDAGAEALSKLAVTSATGRDTNAVLVATRTLWDVVGRRIFDVSRTLGSRRLIVLPQGGSTMALLHAAARGVDGDRRTLADDFDDVRYAPSAFVLGHVSRPGRREATGPALAVGISQHVESPELEFAALEAEVVARELGTKALSENEASVETLLDRLTDASHAHIVCHGVLPPDEPLEGALLLAGTERLTLATLFRRLSFAQSPRLVTLSACDLAQGDRDAPDAFVGFPAAFLEAGASGVISSLWPVDDFSTPLLMSRFYSLHLGEGVPPGAALARAQGWLRKLTRDEGARAFERWNRRDVAEELRAGGAGGDACFWDPSLWAPFGYWGA